MSAVYRVRNREYSSDVIERTYDGKVWKIVITPICSKKEGDLLCENIVKYLNKKQ